jgi:hypothetical protein
MRDVHKVREACKGRRRKLALDTYKKRRTAVLVHECTRLLNLVATESTGSRHTTATTTTQFIDLASRTLVVSSVGHALRKLDDLEIVVRTGICARTKTAALMHVTSYGRRKRGTRS